MSVRIWVGSERGDLDSRSGPIMVSMDTGTAHDGPTLSITLTTLSEQRGVVIAGKDLVALLKVLAFDPRHRPLFSEDWTHALDIDSAAKAERSAAIAAMVSIAQENDLP